MTTGEQAELIVNLRLRDQFTAPVKKLQGNLQTLDRQTAQLQRGLGKIGQGLKTGIGNAAKIAAVGVGFLAIQLRAGIQELIEWEDAQLQVNAAIKSTKGVAGVTSKAVEDLADKYADLSLAEDDVILGASALLLRFPKVTKDVFEPALKASLDLAQAFKMDLNSATRLVARALDDPVEGLSRLSRAGVKFTEQEKEKIKTLVASGRTLDAQNIILRRLERRVGGSAQNATRGFRGQVKLLNDRVKDLQATFAGPLLPAITTMVSELIKFAEKPEIVQQVKDFGAALASFVTQENIQQGFDGIKSGFTFIRDLPWDTIKSGLQTTADIAGRAVSLFRSLPPELQTGLVTLLAANKLTGGLVAQGIGDIAGFLLRNLTTVNAAVVNVFGARVNGGGTGTVPLGPPIPGKTPPKGPQIKTPVMGGKALLAQIAFAIFGPQLIPGLDFGNMGVGIGLNASYGLEDEKTQRIFGDRTDQIEAWLKRTGQSMPAPFGRVGPGTADRALLAEAKFIGKLSALAAQGEEGNRLAQDLYTKYSDGVLLAKDGNKLLKDVKVGTAATEKEMTAVKGAIERQKVNVALEAHVNISAVATGNAVTFGSGTNRIIIPT